MKITTKSKKEFTPILIELETEAEAYAMLGILTIFTQKEIDAGAINLVKDYVSFRGSLAAGIRTQM